MARSGYFGFPFRPEQTGMGGGGGGGVEVFCLCFVLCGGGGGGGGSFPTSLLRRVLFPKILLPQDRSRTRRLYSCRRSPKFGSRPHFNFGDPFRLWPSTAVFA